MIPKIIHYCWFGGSPLPKSARKCINTWRKFCPDYEIIEWNETNIDVCSIQYVKEAYNAKKYAFVSDYARLYALYTYGGIYLDTDVEVLKSFDDLLANDGVFGFEEKNFVATSFMAVCPKNTLIKEFLDTYSNRIFKNTDGTIDTTTNVDVLSKMLYEKGLKPNNEKQEIDGNLIFPKEYFSPYDYIKAINNSTKNSYCIHWYDVSWLPLNKKIIKTVAKPFHRIFGDDCFSWLKK
ncbi:MAG: glycosyl transferase [Clostridia bacterium]|nr:glycosyl transferase [Clostridia bacterium]